MYILRQNVLSPRPCTAELCYYDDIVLLLSLCMVLLSILEHHSLTGYRNIADSHIPRFLLLMQLCYILKQPCCQYSVDIKCIQTQVHILNPCVRIYSCISVRFSYMILTFVVSRRMPYFGYICSMIPLGMEYKQTFYYLSRHLLKQWKCMLL